MCFDASLNKKRPVSIRPALIHYLLFKSTVTYLTGQRYNHRNLIILVLILLLIIIQLNSGYIFKTDKHEFVLLFLISAAKVSTILIHCSPNGKKFHFFLSNHQISRHLESISCIITAICSLNSGSNEGLKQRMWVLWG